jgi:hypothetical protein
MRYTGLSRLGLAAAIFALPATSAFASGVLTFVCDGDLVARTECCCPGDPHGGTASAGGGASVVPACCCRISRTVARGTPAAVPPRVSAQADTKVLLAPASLVTIDGVVPHAPAWPAIRLAHPPPPGVPILLGKQSFLI